jgi:hypothetical protein
MWNPDKAPALGFESLARRVGVHKARAIFAAYREKLRLENVHVTKLEQAAAAARARRGPAVVKNDFEMMPAYHLAPLTFKQLHRSTLGQRGCKGGEVFDDESFMRDFLKRNPECAPQKIVTGDIRSGWTASLEKAAQEGRMHKAMEMAKVSLTLKKAAEEGRQRLVA